MKLLHTKKIFFVPFEFVEKARTNEKIYFHLFEEFCFDENVPILLAHHNFATNIQFFLKYADLLQKSYLLKLSFGFCTKEITPY